MKRYYCNEINEKLINEQVTIKGWVKKIRKLGKLIFIVLTDRTGAVQIIVDEKNKEFENAKNLTRESVIRVTGIVQQSKDKIEINLNELEIYSVSQVTPLIIENETDALEEVRMNYRFLDLRRPKMQQNIIFRSKVLNAIRQFLFNNNFIEIETPILGKPTPEGARDYLVPSRVFPGKFYALPQSPQIYKQLLMVSGFDRYFQVARCFRDEDLRSDRQPEFTQLDLEFSFTNELEIQTTIENLFYEIFKSCLNVELNIPFMRMNYKDAMENYGSDKPDLRFGLVLQNVTNICQETKFEIFRNVAANNHVIKAIVTEQILTKQNIQVLEKYAKDAGDSSLFWITYDNNANVFNGSLNNKLENNIVQNLLQQNKLESGTVLFIVDELEKANKALGAVRVILGDILALKKENDFKFVWIVNWPLFEYDKQTNNYLPAHHPFTQPQDQYHNDFDTNKKDALSKSYDIVLNGYELGGGSIRITNPEMQERMFKTIGLSENEIRAKFGYLIDAFKYGVPPHGGLAIGIDRLVALMLNLTNIKDVIAFPKNASAFDQMLKSPSQVNLEDLDELGIKIK